MRRVMMVLAPTILGLTPAPSAYTVEGRITDRVSGAPLEGASVALVAAGRSATTDAEGGFTFRALPIPGTDEMVITHAEYRTARVPLGTLPDGAWWLEITLVREAGAVGGDRPAERPTR